MRFFSRSYRVKVGETIYGRSRCRLWKTREEQPHISGAGEKQQSYPSDEEEKRSCVNESEEQPYTNEEAGEKPCTDGQPNKQLPSGKK